MTTTIADGEAPFRVLSLDGGGIKGTYSAAFLAEVERMTGKSIADHFDLIVGTSTGGIIALGLGLGLSAQQVLEFYVRRGPQIFPLISSLARFRGFFRHLRKAKHEQRQLRSALEDVFGNRLLGESKVRLVVPAYDGSSGDVWLFKTSHHPKFGRDYPTPAVNVALATSAAPTYLPAFKGANGTTLVDGGLWANCPAAVAAVEALTVLEAPYGSIDMLSVGTTEEPAHINRRKAFGGRRQWALTAVETFMQAQAKGALSQAKLLTKDRLLRVTEVVEPRRFALDDPREIDHLRALGCKAGTHMEQEVSRRFLFAPAPPFTPYRGPRSKEGPGAA